MSKRHQAHRRKTYGRRQHELEERMREPAAERSAPAWDERRVADRFAFLDPHTLRVRYTAGE